MMVLQFGGRTLQKLTTLVGIARQGAFWWHALQGTSSGRSSGARFYASKRLIGKEKSFIILLQENISSLEYEVAREAGSYLSSSK